MDVSDGVSEYSLSACNCIKKIFEKLQQDIAIGNISVTQLRLLRKKWESAVIKILLPISLNKDYFKKCLDELEIRVTIFNFLAHLLKHFAKIFSGKLQGICMIFDINF